MNKKRNGIYEYHNFKILIVILKFDRHKENSVVSRRSKILASRRHSTTAFHHYSHQGTPCEHCKLIDDGDVAMYRVTCPKCGDIPRSRRHMYPNLSPSGVGAIDKCINSPI